MVTRGLAVPPSADQSGELSDHEAACRYVRMSPRLFDEFLDHLTNTSRAVGCPSPRLVIRLELDPPLDDRGTMRFDLQSGAVWVSFHEELDDLTGRLDAGASAHVRRTIENGLVPVIVFRPPYFAIFAVAAQITTRKI